MSLESQEDHATPRWRLLNPAEIKAVMAKERPISSSELVHTAGWYCQHCDAGPSPESRYEPAASLSVVAWVYGDLMKHMVNAYVLSIVVIYCECIPDLGCLDTRWRMRSLGRIFSFSLLRPEHHYSEHPSSWSTLNLRKLPTMRLRSCLFRACIDNGKIWLLLIFFDSMRE